MALEPVRPRRNQRLPIRSRVLGLIRYGNLSDCAGIRVATNCGVQEIPKQRSPDEPKREAPDKEPSPRDPVRAKWKAKFKFGLVSDQRGLGKNKQS
jgi:hypothetical protein